MASSTRVGGRLNLSVDFRSASVPSRKFYQNGDEVNLNDPRIEVSMNDCNTNLTIHNAQTKDEGIFTCIAENEFSIATSSTYVTLFHDESEIVKQAPEFIRTLDPKDNMESENSLDLTCQVQSFTPFDIQWKHNSKMVSFDLDKYR